MSRVRLDHNATTPLRPEARDAWLRTVDALGGNPSSVHAAGRAARDRVDRARERVAAALGVHEDEILFTSGGTESNNLALAGALEAAGPGAGLVTTAIEHSSVLEPARTLERRGHPLTVLAVDAGGQPDLDALESALATDAPPALVSIQAANNEIGCVPRLANVAELLDGAAGRRPALHVDAAQALGRLPLELERWGVGLATFSAHKVGGPVGVGVLVVRKGTRLTARTHGGGQERELRPGTEDVAGIVSAACAVELAVAEREDYAARLSRLTTFLWEELVAQMPDVRCVGPALDETRLPNTLNVLIPERRGKVLVTALDLAGLEVSAGSACASGSVEPSHVLTALGFDEDDARSGLRLSLGRTTTRAECTRAVEILWETSGSSRAS